MEWKMNDEKEKRMRFILIFYLQIVFFRGIYKLNELLKLKFVRYKLN